MRGTLADVRFGIRMLRRNRGFAAVAIVTLALGIGANTAMFSVLNAVVLRALPFPDPGRLVALQGRQGARILGLGGTSLPDFEDWRREARGFEGLATSSYWTFNLAGRGEPMRILGGRVSGDFFTVLGTPALLGRTLEPADDRAEAPAVIVLAHGLWTRAFAGDPHVLGTTLTLNGVPHVVVGVMPPGFAFPSPDQEMWGALSTEMSGAPRDARFLLTLGRLAQRATVADAQASLDVVAARLAAAHAGTNRGWGAHVVPLHEALFGSVRPALLMLAGAVGFVLLIACANVSNLLLARAAFRRRELAIRAALGASGARLARQLVAENLVLAAGGGALGLALAQLAVVMVRRLGPQDVPRLEEVSLDPAVLAFTCAVSAATGIVLGLLPALPAARGGLRPALSDADRAATAARSRLRRGLVVAETALALTLLVGGGLLVRSFHNLMAVPLGFDAPRLVSGTVLLAPPRYRGLAEQRAFVHDVLASAQELPGVVGAAMTSQMPLEAGPVRLKFAVEGRPVDRADAPSASYRAVSPSYFRTLGIPLRAGRPPADSDTAEAPPVVVVNEVMAARSWPGESPLGRRIAWIPEADPAQGAARWHTVVGVVGDVRSEGLHVPEGPAAYVPFPQRQLGFVRSASFVVRTVGDPAAAVAALRGAIRRVDPEQPVFNVGPVDAVVARSVAGRRFVTVLLEVFAGLAFALAVIGIYGLLSYTVGQRTREIGIRMALGAPRRRVFGLVVGDGLGLALAGVALGLPLAVLLARALGNLLFGVAPWDPATLALVSLGLAGSAVLACAVPARRALRVDPVVALRHE
jgi:predicted permease